MPTPEVPINPATLLWARKRACADEEQAAKKAGVDVARLQAWEAGTEQPTVSQLRHLADLYKRPLAFFLLDDVPKDFTVMKAFRRLPESDDLALSFQLALQLRQALQRREIALALAPEVGDEPESFREKASQADSPTEIGNRIRSVLGITLASQQRWKDDYQAFRAWRHAVEELGVLTFQAASIDVQEMRGLSVFHSVYPIVLLNSGDAVRGRIFTLAHELGHLLLRSEATRDSDDVLNDPHAAEEVWCNEFAGALLVPLSSLAWSSDERSPDRFDWNTLRAEANRFKVSQQVILRRLLAARHLSRKEYQSLHRELVRRTPVRKSEGGPVPQDVKVVSRLGIPFVRTVVAAYRQQKITLSDVADYLDVRVKYLHDIENRVMKGEYEAGAET